MAAYTWADIDPHAHAATTHRLARLHSRHPLLLPPETIEGWDTRLPMDAITITPALFTQAFPAGMDLIMTSPPCYHNTFQGHIRDRGNQPTPLPGR